MCGLLVCLLVAGGWKGVLLTALEIRLFCSNSVWIKLTLFFSIWKQSLESCLVSKSKDIFMGQTNSSEVLLIYATGKPHPLWHEFGEAMGSCLGELWVIDQEFIACFLITLEVGTCFIHPFPLDPSLSQRVCTEVLAAVIFGRQWSCTRSCSVFPLVCLV